MNVVMKNSKLTKVILLLSSISISIILCEFALRILYPSLLVQECLWPPYLTKIFRPIPGIMPGISGDSKFITNSYGIRGDELSSKYTKRILAIGGSTTGCLYLNQTEAWPYLLQKKLNEKLGRNDIWVGNVGISGENTYYNIKLLKCFLLKRFKIDTAILLTGINDFCRRLALDKNYVPFSQQKTEEDSPFFKKTALWGLTMKIKKTLSKKSGEETQDDVYTGKIYATWRANRSRAKKIIDALPDLSSALREYAWNINAIIDIAEKNKIRIIFMTQPTLWQAGLSPQLRSLLWFGGIGKFQTEEGCEYYSVKALHDGMEKYNNTLLTICKLRNVECIDLASLLPKDTSIFYDDCHFNENGSRKTSEILAQYLLKHL